MKHNILFSDGTKIPGTRREEFLIEVRRSGTNEWLKYPFWVTKVTT